jgi:hypothetical protein
MPAFPGSEPKQLLVKPFDAPQAAVSVKPFGDIALGGIGDTIAT